MTIRDLGRGVVIAQHPQRNKDGGFDEPRLGSTFDVREDHEPTEEGEPVKATSSFEVAKGAKKKDRDDAGNIRVNVAANEAQSGRPTTDKKG